MSSSHKIYTSIERLPIACWEKVKETQDKRFLLILEPDEYFDLPEVKDTSILEETWVKLENEWLDNFGNNQHSVEIIKLSRQISILNAKRIIENNPSLLSIVMIKQKELDDYIENNLNSSEKKLKFEEQLIIVEKWIGHAIDPFKCSTKKFHTYIELYKKQMTRT